MSGQIGPLLSLPEEPWSALVALSSTLSVEDKKLGKVVEVEPRIIVGLRFIPQFSLACGLLPIYPLMKAELQGDRTAGLITAEWDFYELQY